MSRSRINLLTLAALAALAASALSSCASAPRPESEADSLVIGSIVLDYPESFFDFGPKTIDRNLAVEFENITKGKTFTVMTMAGGYFFFVSNGADSYRLRQVRYDFRSNQASYKLSTNLDIPFAASPHAIMYLDYMTITNSLLSAPKDDRVDGGHYSWSYKRSFSSADRREDMLAFLRESDPQSPWEAGYEVRRLLDRP
ncbi:MAG TPA: hypothetical protein P5142_02310 [Spirochaetia bacterium]|nr:hypothetical protein [Spirochaetia bacterium]